MKSETWVMKSNDTSIEPG